jgi:hypothetical protein
MILGSFREVDDEEEDENPSMGSMSPVTPTSTKPTPATARERVEIPGRAWSDLSQSTAATSERKKGFREILGFKK